jgi:hypothetical protein
MPPPDTLGTFVGRQRELQLLRCAWEEACAGRGALVTLVGEAGIGKTRTAEEFAREIESSGASVSWGRCEEAAAAPGYWPWIQLLRHALQVAVEDEIAADLRAALGGRLRPDTHGSEPAGVRLRLFDQILELLARRARVEPLMLVVDDLHWADAGSLRLLAHVGRDLRRHRVLIVATYREAELAARRDDDDCVGALARHALRIALGGLERAEVGALASARARRALDAGVVAQVHAHTAGNPFFVDTVVRLLGTPSGGDASSLENLRLPAEVRAAIRRHLAHLSAGTRELLEVACALGSELAPDLLEDVTGMPPSLLQATLETALHAGVLKQTSDPQARLGFAHPLIREALYQDLEAERRHELHARVGRSLEKRAASLRKVPLASLAYHFWAAGPRVEVERSIHYLRAAGAKAMEGLAYEEAACQYQRALRVLEHETHLAGYEREQLELWLALGGARCRGGCEPAARRAYETAAAIARDLGDADALAAAALGVGVTTAERGAPDVALIALLEEAIACQRGPRLRVRLLGRLSSALYFSQDTERRERTSREALDLARRLDDPGCLADALTRRYFALWGPDTDPAERRALAEEALQVAEVSGDGVLQLQARQWRIVSLLEQGDVDALDLELERYGHAAEELRIPTYLWHLEVVRATRAAMRGELAESERRVELALSVRNDGELSNARPFHMVQLDAVRQLDGRIEELRRAFEALPADAPRIWRSGLARFHVEIGEVEQARRELELLAARDFLDLRRDVQWLPTLCVLAQVCHGLGDAARASLLAPLLSPYAGRRVVVAHGAACYGVVDRFLGLIAETCGQLEPAIRWFEQAIEAELQIGAQALATRARIDCARARLRRGHDEDRVRASALLRDAQRSAALLGLRALSEQAARIDSHAHPSPARPATAPPRSTPRAVLRREGEFWTLEHGSDVARLRGSKGLAHLARLLDCPGRELHVLDLYLPADRSENARAGAHDAGERIDARARDEYRTRLLDLQDQLEEAEGFADLSRAARAREEIEVLTEELSASVGIGGRLRRTGSPTERARVNVTRTLRDALDRIRSESPEVGRLLVASIRTGTYCSYDPAPEHSLDWCIQA